MAIGCDTKIVTTCPTSFVATDEPGVQERGRHQQRPDVRVRRVLRGVGGVDRQRRFVHQHPPGITFFANLNKIGNFVPGGTAATAAAGTTPILIWWDYLQNGVAASVPGWKSVIPSDGTIAAYYTQAITKDAPDPAAARLWEEFLYSSLGQNLFLQGYARPIELPGMIANHTVNQGVPGEVARGTQGRGDVPDDDPSQHRQGHGRIELGLGNQRRLIRPSQ